MTTEGEKTCNNLEQGVLNRFQRRELEGCQKTKIKRNLGEVSCSRGRLLLQRLVATHKRS